MATEHQALIRSSKRRWRHMIRRCCDSSDKNYKNYGGRGIKVCDEWINSFEKYLEDVGLPPSPGLHLDRRDNNLGYSKDNCRWVTPLVNSRNRRMTRRVKTDSGEMNLFELADKYKADYDTIVSRYKRGERDISELTKPKDQRFTNRYDIVIDGVKKSIAEIAKELNSPPGTIYSRLYFGKSLTAPKKLPQTVETPFGKITLRELSDKTGIHQKMLEHRVKKGETGETLCRPVKVAKKYEIDGISKTIPEWCKELKINKNTVYWRMESCGMTAVEALTKPVNIIKVEEISKEPTKPCETS